MSSTNKAPPRRGAASTALSDFAEYVEQQQALRHRTVVAVAGPSTGATSTIDVEDELSIIDQLGLGDDADGSDKLPLRDVLLLPAEDDSKPVDKLKGIISGLVTEGMGETIFDVGTEANGDLMKFTEVDYRKALKRVEEVSLQLKCRITELLVDQGEKGTTGEDGKGQGWHSKVLIRRKPEVVEELLEIRVAVVGNGESSCLHTCLLGADC